MKNPIETVLTKTKPAPPMKPITFVLPAHIVDLLEVVRGPIDGWLEEGIMDVIELTFNANGDFEDCLGNLEYVQGTAFMKTYMPSLEKAFRIAYDKHQLFGAAVFGNAQPSAGAGTGGQLAGTSQ